MNSIEKSAKTVDEAIALALVDLKVDKNAVKIEIMEEGSRGIFGFIGNKMAKVKVSLKAPEQNIPDATTVSEETDTSELAIAFVTDVITKIGVTAHIEASSDEEGLHIKISGDQVGVLIGRRGETLDALQYLTGLVCNKGQEPHLKVLVDVESYRSRRQETLMALADRLAKKVARTRKSVTLEPMTANERRIIHAALQGNTAVDTYSTGAEPYRKIVIKPKG